MSAAKSSRKGDGEEASSRKRGRYQGSRRHALLVLRNPFPDPASFQCRLIFLPPPRPSSRQKHYPTEMGGSEEYAPGFQLKVRFRQTLDPHLTLSGRIPAETIVSDGEHEDRFNRQYDHLILEITQAYLPFTMAVVCRSRLISTEYADRNNTPDRSPSPLPAECILKLYDRRHVDNMRDDFDAGKRYDEEKESAYQRYLLDPNKRSHDFVADLFSSDSGSDDDLEDGGAFEDYLAHRCESMWEKEVQAYERMRDLQGEMIPRLLGLVNYDPPLAVIRDGVPQDCLVVKGVLLEYIPAITLTQYITCQLQHGSPIDHDAIAHVSQQAVALVNTIGENGVLNEDVRLDNILVRRQGEVPPLQQLMYDPALPC